MLALRPVRQCTPHVHRFYVDRSEHGQICDTREVGFAIQTGFCLDGGLCSGVANGSRAAAGGSHTSARCRRSTALCPLPCGLRCRFSCLQGHSCWQRSRRHPLQALRPERSDLRRNTQAWNGVDHRDHQHTAAMGGYRQSCRRLGRLDQATRARASAAELSLRDLKVAAPSMSQRRQGDLSCLSVIGAWPFPGSQ